MSKNKHMNKEITSEEVKAIQLNLLQTVHDFCLKHKINYSLAYGTLLGAVRHGGYIPWDDDIDIAMLRDDYELFAQMFNKENRAYHFYDCRNDKDVHIGFGKVADTRTLVVEGAATKNLGVAIDIFPIDDLGDTYEEAKRFLDSFKVWKYLRIMKSRDVSAVRTNWKKPLFVLAKLLFLWYPLHKIPQKMLKRVLDNRMPNSKYVGLILGSGFSEKAIVERSMWKDLQQIGFENGTFLAIRDFDKYLRREYGNYMEFPPEEERVPQHDFYGVYRIENV